MAQLFLRTLHPLSNNVLTPESRCMICLIPYNTIPFEGHIPEHAVRLPCNHDVGSDCIARWLFQDNDNNSCPYCKTKLFQTLDQQLSPRPHLASQDMSPIFELFRKHSVAIDEGKWRRAISHATNNLGDSIKRAQSIIENEMELDWDIWAACASRADRAEMRERVCELALALRELPFRLVVLYLQLQAPGPKAREIPFEAQNWQLNEWQMHWLNFVLSYNLDAFVHLSEPYSLLSSTETWKKLNEDGYVYDLANQTWWRPVEFCSPCWD